MGWFRSFTLDGIDRQAVDYNLYHAGLAVRFAIDEEQGDEGVAGR